MTIASLARILAASVIGIAGLVALGALVVTVETFTNVTAWTAEAVFIVAVADLSAVVSVAAAVVLWRKARQLT